MIKYKYEPVSYDIVSADHFTFLTDNNLPVQLMAAVIKVIGLPVSQENLTVPHLSKRRKVEEK